MCGTIASSLSIVYTRDVTPAPVAGAQLPYFSLDVPIQNFIATNNNFYTIVVTADDAQSNSTNDIIMVINFAGTIVLVNQYDFAARPTQILGASYSTVKQGSGITPRVYFLNEFWQTNQVSWPGGRSVLTIDAGGLIQCEYNLDATVTWSYTLEQSTQSSTSQLHLKPDGLYVYAVGSSTVVDILFLSVPTNDAFCVYFLDTGVIEIYNQVGVKVAGIGNSGNFNVFFSTVFSAQPVAINQSSLSILIRNTNSTTQESKFKVIVTQLQ